MRLFLKTIIWVLPLVFVGGAKAQTTYKEVINGDTTFLTESDPILVSSGMDNDAKQAYMKLKSRVKKVMPLAKMAAARLKVMEDNLATKKTKKEKKKYIKECEESLKQLYKDQLKDLTIEEGKILMKLIHRETGQTTWEIMKKYRGSTETIAWQAFGSIYGHNMKDDFDPVLDYQIENIIKVEKLE